LIQIKKGEKNSKKPCSKGFTKIAKKRKIKTDHLLITFNYYLNTISRRFNYHFKSFTISKAFIMPINYYNAFKKG